MPLDVQIKRKGKPLDLNWGGFHMAAMCYAAAFDSGKGPWVENSPKFHYPEDPGEGYEWLADKTEADYPEIPYPITPSAAWLIGYPHFAATPLNHGTYTLKNEHKFIDCTDGEIFHLLPGDELIAYRSMRW